MQVFKKEFYTALAHLFYAIAMADKKMVVDEKRRIVAFVEKYWTVTVDTENSAEIIYETLRTLIKKNWGADPAFEVFKAYRCDHIEEFSQDVCKQLMETVDGIALSASGRNKSELVLLTKTHNLLFKSP